MKFQEKDLLSLYGSSRVTKPYLCKDGRTRIDVFTDGKYLTMQLAKLKLELNLGRRLIKGETVDHIDEDKSNDSIDNLQVLSKSENAKKSLLLRGVNPLDGYMEWRRTTDGRMATLGQTRGTKNGMSKFTDLQIADIRSRENYYGLINKLMSEYACSRRTIQNIRHGKSY